MQVFIYHPAGNDTALVLTKPNNERTKIAERILKMHSNIEQVGFIYKDEQNRCCLEMAGGEMCLNALRSAANYFITNHNASEIYHCNERFSCCIKDQLTSTKFKLTNAQIKPLDEFSKCALVELGGIHHLCALINPSEFKSFDEESLKKLAMQIFIKYNLNKREACGLMLLAFFNNSYHLAPVVWVRDLSTLYYETACGSGSVASLLFLNQLNKINNLALKQPSGKELFLSLSDDKSIEISSEVVLINNFEFIY